MGRGEGRVGRKLFVFNQRIAGMGWGLTRPKVCGSICRQIRRAASVTAAQGSEAQNVNRRRWFDFGCESRSERAPGGQRESTATDFADSAEHARVRQYKRRPVCVPDVAEDFSKFRDRQRKRHLEQFSTLHRPESSGRRAGVRRPLRRSIRFCHCFGRPQNYRPALAD